MYTEELEANRLRWNEVNRRTYEVVQPFWAYQRFVLNERTSDTGIRMGFGLMEAGMKCVGYAECDTKCETCQTFTQHEAHPKKSITQSA
ncbi:hypothetical protein [Paenibacillus sp. 2TAB26]|uniref:hypothetical protein n=1 Tax=Paenibacillus sp. 2TAB26 TaxID=3233005 RepID=UPI003F94C818